MTPDAPPRPLRFPRPRHVRNRLRREWEDLRLLLLTWAGGVPSHRFRRFVYRRFGLVVPRDTALHWRARFFDPERITIGHHTNLGNDLFLDGRMGLTIGDCVNIAGDVHVYTLGHDIDDPDFAGRGGPVVIEDYVFVGSRAMILPGVRVGRGAVVAAGAVVTKDVPPFTMVAGVPARFVRERSRELRYKLGYAKRFQ